MPSISMEMFITNEVEKCISLVAFEGGGGFKGFGGSEINGDDRIRLQVYGNILWLW